jgi:TolB-like protein
VRFSFDDYVLDTDTRELRRGPKLISLAPQAFDLLAYLVQTRERVVSRDDLFKFVWSGRVVSESTLTSHINAVRKAVGDTGDAQQLVRTIARKGFRFVGTVIDEQSPSGPVKSTVQASRNEQKVAASATYASAPTLPDKPSIAVLPFQNLSGDPTQDYFADGMVEDIITALSRMRWLFVIARNSTFTYKGRPIDVKQVGRELGVRYLLEGSVRRAANRVRITTQLVDATTGAHIWADRFDGTLDDIFDIQDKVATSVVGAIVRQLEQAEIERSRRKPTESLVAYDYYLRGMALFNQRTKEAVNEALRLFYRAIDLDPDFASAYGQAAWCYGWRKINGWMEDRGREIAETRRLGRRAAELGPDDAVALSRGGHALAFVVGDLNDAAAFIDRALVVNPSLAGAWYASGWLRVWLGEPDLAIAHLGHAMRLSPLDLQMVAMRPPSCIRGTALQFPAAARTRATGRSLRQPVQPWPKNCWSE